MSGLILVSITWLNSAHKMMVATMTVSTAGSRRRMRRIQKSLRSMRPVPRYSTISRWVMRYPDSTKNIVTPWRPPWIHEKPRW